MSEVNNFFYLNASLLKLNFYFFLVFEPPFFLELYAHIFSSYKKSNEWRCKPL